MLREAPGPLELLEQISKCDYKRTCYDVIKIQRQRLLPCVMRLCYIRQNKINDLLFSRVRNAGSLKRRVSHQDSNLRTDYLHVFNDRKYELNFDKSEI